jgi:hypothetical protein
MRDMESLISECKSDQGAQPTLHPLGPSTPFPILVNGTCGSLMHFSSLQLKCKPPIWRCRGKMRMSYFSKVEMSC